MILVIRGVYKLIMVSEGKMVKAVINMLVLYCYAQ